MSQTACGGNGRMHILRPMNQPLIQGFQILDLDPLHVGVDQDRGGIVADHATPVSRARPLGEETTFLIGIDQTFLHLLINRGEHHVQEGEQTTERIPKTGIGIHITRQNLAIIGTVMDDLSISVNLIEFTREQQRTIHTRIEGPILVQITTVDLNLAQILVPGRFSLLDNRIETVATQLLQIDLCLLRTDKRGSHLRMNDLSLTGSETDHGTDMIIRLLLHTLAQASVREGCLISEWLIKLDHEIVLEIIGHATAVLRGITNDLVLLRNDLDGRTLIESVDHDIRMLILRESKAEHRGPVGRRQLRHDVVLRQVYLIIISLRHLSLVREPAGPLILVKLRLTDDRHDRELSIVIDPRTGLVRLLETTDLVCRIDILPPIAHLACLWRPEIHTPRPGDSRVSVTGRQLESRLRSHQRINILHGIESARVISLGGL